MTKKSTSSTRKSITMFVLLAFGIIWLGWVPGLLAANQQGWMMPSFSNYADFFEVGIQSSKHLWLSIAFSLAVFGH